MELIDPCAVIECSHVECEFDPCFCCQKGYFIEEKTTPNEYTTRSSPNYITCSGCIYTNKGKE